MATEDYISSGIHPDLLFQETKQEGKNQQMTRAILTLVQWASAKNCTRRWRLVYRELVNGEGGVQIEMEETRPRPLVGPPVTKAIDRIISRETLTCANFDVLDYEVTNMIGRLNQELLKESQ